MQSTLKLGTRRSLLAMAQSGWVAREIERLNPGVRVELVGIDTRGDKIVDVSLREVQGKEFFVAELDDALRSGEVDLTVHSMKDLSLDRPAEFVLGAIPKRENPRDVVLFGPSILDKLKGGKTIRIGTSSPRRLENIPPFLARALPKLSDKAPKIEFVEIRGNVNTRLGRVHEASDSPKHLDAVVLAFAGLIRLWADDQARVELKKLLKGVRWMVLPLWECPAAPAQGALAVECRAADSRVRAMLAKLHDAETARQVGHERALLAQYGGGCHQQFGATCISTHELQDLMFIRGKKPDGEHVEELRWPEMPAPVMTDVVAWDGSEHKAAYQVSQALVSRPKFNDAGVFIAHSRALPEDWVSSLAKARVWTSGIGSWVRLAEKGVWVEGCAEKLGFAEIAETIKEPVLQLPSFERWKILTHEGALSSWHFGDAISTYRVESGVGTDASREALQKATHVYWNSGSQYAGLKQWVPAQAQHACGSGKTARYLRKQGLKPIVFPSVKEWRKWLKI